MKTTDGWSIYNSLMHIPDPFIKDIEARVENQNLSKFDGKLKLPPAPLLVKEGLGNKNKSRCK